MSDTFYLSERGQAYYIHSGSATQLSLDLEGFEALAPKSYKEGACHESVVLVQNVSVAKSGIAVPVVGVDKKRLLYSFGENFGQVRIEAIVLTGGTKYEATEPKSLIEKWGQKSIVEKKEPLNLDWAGNSMKVYVKDITAAAVDAQHGTIKIEMNALIAPVTNKEG